MGIRGSPLERCAVCGLPAALCPCAQLPRLACQTSWLLLSHAHDAERPSNTSRLLVRCLGGSQRIVYGGPDRASHPAAPPHLVLHPDGRPLCAADARPGLRVTVPDGTWSQVRRMLARVVSLRAGELVSVPPPTEPVPFIRREPQPGHVCTFVAVAQALGVLEGAELRDELLAVYRMVAGRQLALRTGSPLELAPPDPNQTVTDE